MIYSPNPPVADRKPRIFQMNPAFMAQFEGRQPKWGPVGYFTYKRCVDVATPVLCDDLIWRPAGELVVGQGIIGFDEEKGRALRHVRMGRVVHNKVEKADTVGIELEDGTVLYATPDHPWLVKLSKTDNRMYWKKSEELGGTHKKGSMHLIRPFGPVWSQDETFEGGFLSAAFDGEGCFDRLNSLSFIQTGNGMLEKVEGILASRQVPYTKSTKAQVVGRQECFTLRVNSRRQFFPLLGSLRPPRLLEAFKRNVDKVNGDLGTLRCNPQDYVKVVRVFPAGERDIAILSTDLGTHFTGGFASHNTYARTLPDGRSEEFWQTVQRVVEGCFNIQKIHARTVGTFWNEAKAQKSAQDMFTRIWDFKFTPPGRGLWMMGTDLLYEKGSAALNNCAFVSTDKIAEDFSAPFCFLMDMSMLGVGVGGDTRGVGTVRIQAPKVDTQNVYSVGDSREGWVDVFRLVLNTFVGKASYPQVIDFSLVRKRGTPIVGFGGIASGSAPLKKLIECVTRLLLPEGMTVTFTPSDDTSDSLRVAFEGTGVPYKIRSTQIVDVFNYTGKCVVAGGVRRCLPKGTLVHTEDGLIPIEDVQIGSKVMASQGLSVVTDWVEQGVQPISRIATQMGSFEATDKHKIAIISDVKGGYVWKQLHEVEPGDRMVFVDRPIAGTDTDFPSFQYKAPPHSTTCRNITIPKLDADTAWLLGLIAGDGYVSDREVTISTHADQAEIRDRAVRILGTFGVSVTIQTREGENCVVVRAKSKQLATFFGLYKQAKVPLSVPDIILCGLPHVRAAYVAGLADADGCFLNRPLTVAVSVYPFYLEGVQAVLASLGVPSRLRLHQDKQRSLNGWQPLYNLTVVGEKALARFQQQVTSHSVRFVETRATSRSQHDYGFPSAMALEAGISGYKDGQMKWSRDSRQITVARLEDLAGSEVVLVPVEVLEIEHGVREDMTYDISVEAGEFVAQGGYLVHNTAEIMFGSPEDQDFLSLKSNATLLPLYAESSRIRGLMNAVGDPGSPEAADYAAQLLDIDMQIQSHPLNDMRWASNNSIFAEVGMDYSGIAKAISENGEPGLFWLENARAYSRMIDPPDWKDDRVAGTNPCFAGDTLIAVADGRGAVPIRQLVTEGLDVPVYSVRPDGKVEIQIARNPRLTREHADLVDIVLDDGTSIRVTPNHKMRLLDGAEVEAQNLQPGDSLPRFTKRLSAIGEGKNYLRVNCDTLNGGADKVFEHRLIAKFAAPDDWNATYDEGKKSGWVKGGLVVHHKDFDRTNNAPENLQIMTFRDHVAHHNHLADVAGDRNPMWGRTHTDESKARIGAKTKERCTDPVFLQKLAASHSAAERAEAAERLSATRKTDLLAYYKTQAETTDLDTVWMSERLHAVKVCEACGDDFVVPWRVREQSFCSRSCGNKKPEGVADRKEGLAAFHKNQQRQVLHQQVMSFKDLQEKFGRDPLKSEWESETKNRGVPVRFRTSGSTPNPHALKGFTHLKEVASEYNHRVVEVRAVEGQESVYNLTVDQNHTVGVVTAFDTETKECHGVFTFQCGEQSLESFELCNLVETYPAHHDSFQDFQKTLKMAYLYAKTVTLVPTHDPRANQVMQYNRRIGASMSGIVQACQKFGFKQFTRWCDGGYAYIKELDNTYSRWLGVPNSKKMTSVKPSGSVSLLCGASPGIHYPHSEFYIRRVRVATTSPLVAAVVAAGYHVEPDQYADDTVCVSFPVKENHFIKGKNEATIWEQFALAVMLQRHWADNQVSVTITFNKREERDIATCLSMFDDGLKAVSLLPLSEHGYAQAPYEEIDEARYYQMVACLSPLDLTDTNVHDLGAEDKFCSNDTCEVKFGSSDPE